MHAIILATLAAVATARPSYIAVPADQITFVDLRSLHVRVPRQTLTPPPLQNLYNQDYQPVPIPLQQYQNLQQYQQIQQEPVNLNPAPQPEAPRLVRLQQQDVSSAASIGTAEPLAERPADFGEYVDFGAHTGDNGAFGWYADYPINNHDDHHGYRK